MTTSPVLIPDRAPNLIAAVAFAIHSNPKQFTVYNEPLDYAGLGYPHQMVTWIDEFGYPQSIVTDEEE